MGVLGITVLFTVIWWTLFYISFKKDRSKYRNCYLLFFALLSMYPLIFNLPEEGRRIFVSLSFLGTVAGMLIIPIFLIINGIVMVRREGRHLSHMLSLALGLVIFLAEFLTAIWAFLIYFRALAVPDFVVTWLTFIESLLNITVFYGSFSFLVFMIYTLFLHIVPRKKDFDYIIIHGAGLIDGERLTKLLQDRVDKAISVYRKDPTPPFLIPSGGKGSDEKISEAEAMRRYLISKGIPESDIILEDRSATTFENLKNSKDIIDSTEGRKYTALVTSNYHVYRALRYCKAIGLKCTGIGSRVAFYYWPSALIREYIAIHAEKKHAVIFVIGWLICVAPLLLTALAALRS